MSKKPTPLAELAARHGVEVGDFTLRRMAEIRRSVDELAEALDVAKSGGPTQFPRLSTTEIQELYAQEAAGLVLLEEKLMPYFHAKKTPEPDDQEDAKAPNVTINL